MLTRGTRGRLDLTGVGSLSDLLMLYNIFERYPLHLGYFFANMLAHQGYYVCLGAIFTGPYITRLIRGMGLIERTQGMQIVVPSLHWVCRL